MSAFPLTASTFPVFFLVSVRCTAMLIVAPIFSARPIPLMARVGLALLLALVLAPTLGSAGLSLQTWAFAGLVLQEVLVGLVLGLTAQAVFQVIQMAASLVELQMGLSIAGLVDPLGSSSSAVLSQFYAAFAALALLAFDGHHMMLLGLSQSLQVMPLGDPGVLALSPERWVVVSGRALESALRLSLPVTGALLLADVAMAMLARMLPQMNVLITTMPAKIALGFAALAVALPTMAASLGPWARALAESPLFVLGGR